MINTDCVEMYEIKDQVWDKVEYEVSNQVCDQVRNQVYLQVDHKVWVKLWWSGEGNRLRDRIFK